MAYVTKTRLKNAADMIKKELDIVLENPDAESFSIAESKLHTISDTLKLFDVDTKIYKTFVVFRNAKTRDIITTVDFD